MENERSVYKNSDIQNLLFLKKSKTDYVHLDQVSVNLTDMVRPIDPGSQLLSRRLYHQEQASWEQPQQLTRSKPGYYPVLIYQPWKDGRLSQVQQCEEIGRSDGMISTGNRTRVVHMVVQWFPHYATAALSSQVIKTRMKNILQFC